MLNVRKKKNNSKYVDWVRSWDIKFPMPKRVQGKWKLVTKAYHFEKTFKAMPAKEHNIYSKIWQSKKGNSYFELILGRREHD